MSKTRKLPELLLFIIVFVLYAISVSKSINFWDSSEFITSNYTLQASHPPGAPLYTILCGAVLSLFSAASAAYLTNLISGFFGALTVVLLYKITCLVVSQVVSNKWSHYGNKVPIFCGLLAALSLAFSTSFWTAATEAEVYTMSFSLFCALIYVGLLWEKETSIHKQTKLILIFAILLGLAISVHPIIAAIVIPMSVLVAYKKFNPSFKTIGLSLILGIAIFILIYGILFKAFIGVAAAVDIYTVNTLNLNVNTGAIIFFTAILLLISTISLFSKFKKHFNAHIITKAVFLFLLGLGPYLFPIIRSDTNTLVAEKVDTANRLKTYISAYRFGMDNIPLLYGPTYNAELDKARPFLNGNVVYTYDQAEKKYIEVDDGKSSIVNYSSDFKTIFPRMYDAKNEANYKSWTTIKGNTINYEVDGISKQITIPTFGENFNFFINYQLIWLNLRYLFWNFIGRQNDYHGLGYTKNGNWLSGINLIDHNRLGDLDIAPSYYQNNKSKDVYYFLPFVLGLIGIITLRNHKKFLLSSVLLFLTFGLGITLFINPLPSSILVRERDYIFIGSFVVFAFWIGLSLLFIIEKIQQKFSSKILLNITFLVLLIAAPLQLLAKGWDNHQNSKDKFPYEFGKAYLDSCPEQAILITNGDNMTFPLWYLQQVEGYRTDVRVVNFDQLNIDTHIDNLKLKKNSSLPISLDLKKSLYIEGTEKLIPLKKETNDPLNLEVLTRFLNSPKTLTNWNGRLRHYIPGTSFQIPIDTLKISPDYKSISYNLKPVTSITWEYNKAFYGLNDIVLLNLIKNNIFNRAICFANNSKSGHLIGLQDYLVQVGLVSRLMPFKRSANNMNPKIVNTQKSLSILNNQEIFTGLHNDGTYIREENRTYAREILRQNYYFVAQALLEEENQNKAKILLDKSLDLFPNETVPFKEYAFGIGKLYLRMGYRDIGTEICTKSRSNLTKELEWMLSCNPANSIINVRHATKIYNMVVQMTQQLNQFRSEENKSEIEALNALNNQLEVWQKNNWPYPDL